MEQKIHAAAENLPGIVELRVQIVDAHRILGSMWLMDSDTLATAPAAPIMRCTLTFHSEGEADAAVTTARGQERSIAAERYASHLVLACGHGKVRPDRF